MSILLLLPGEINNPHVQRNHVKKSFGEDMEGFLEKKKMIKRSFERKFCNS